MPNKNTLKTVRQQLGQYAEELAADYLQIKGFTIQHYNYRYKKSEIDLIAKKDDCLVFVEVKVRTNINFGYPEAFVAKHQQKMIKKAAMHYIGLKNWHQAIRFDVMAIMKQGDKLQIDHFEDAFY